MLIQVKQKDERFKLSSMDKKGIKCCDLLLCAGQMSRYRKAGKVRISYSGDKLLCFYCESSFRHLAFT